MKLRITFKNPDLISEYIDSVVPYEDSAKCDRAREKVADKFFEFGDYGAVEIDTEAGTGRLVPIKEWARW
jgi:hypothetical protein